MYPNYYTPVPAASELIQEFCPQNKKDKSKYQCPCCGGWNLSFNKTSGAFSCFNGCDSKDIFKKLRNFWAEKILMLIVLSLKRKSIYNKYAVINLA